MTKYETIFILVIGALFFIGWLITVHLYSLQSDRNKDLQLENTDLIDKIEDLQQDFFDLSDKLYSALELLDKKKELLEIQDRLLDENNIKH